LLLMLLSFLFFGWQLLICQTFLLFFALTFFVYLGMNFGLFFVAALMTVVRFKRSFAGKAVLGWAGCDASLNVNKILCHQLPLLPHHQWSGRRYRTRFPIFPNGHGRCGDNAVVCDVVLLTVRWMRAQ
jgi:hypothetical protein